MPCDPADAAACNSGAEGTCELACEGPIIYAIEVPPWWFPPWEPNLIDLTTDSRRAEFNSADTCAYTTNDGWYASFHISECAVVTFNYCCTDPPLQLVSQILVNGCPCGGPVVYIPPDAGRSGYGDECGNGHCCEDGNYSVQWTVRPGTYHYGVPAGTFCDQSGDGCLSSLDCAPDEACKDFSQPLQGHFIFEPCKPEACCNDAYPCVVAGDCPLDPLNPGGEECGVDGFCVDHCLWLSQYECEDSGGDWLGWNPWGFELCQWSPCDNGACCVGGGTCEDNNGYRISPEECAALNGEYHGGITYAWDPCVVCDFEDQYHCQLDTGSSIFPSDRNLGTRRADDFRPLGTPITRVCFNFGFVTEDPPPECSDDPPRDNFDYHIYQDAFGLPGTELPETQLPTEKASKN